MSKDKLRVPRGTVDIYGEDMVIWKHIESVIKGFCDSYCIGEIRTPIFEHTEVFKRNDEDTSDMVNKEMYTFIDRGDRSLTLRPEGTAGVVRAYNENNLGEGGLPRKLYYIGQNFRYERPQAGRQRQFTQFGVEYFGSDTVAGEVEIISLAYSILCALGINDVVLHINSLGDVECRQNYNNTLKDYLNTNKEQFCETCQERIEKNPLRVLDCKNKNCQSLVEEAPKVLETLGEQCTSEFNTLLQKLDNLNIPYVVDKSLVRGLDYYTKTVFEFVSEEIGSQGTVCGGGRYNNLVSEMGGKQTNCVGFGMGLERLVMIYKALNQDVSEPEPFIYIGALGLNGQMLGEKIAFELRSQGIKSELNINDKSVKAQMKLANKSKAEWSTIIGDSEVETKVIKLKHMETGESVEVDLNDESSSIVDKLLTIMFEGASSQEYKEEVSEEVLQEMGLL